MEIVLFVLGVIFVIIGLPFCLSCQIHAYWENRSKGKTNQQIYNHARRDQSIGVFSMIIGVLLIILSFVGSVM
jgi:uncharacterized membrane protein